jgi:hypothetical protein
LLHSNKAEIHRSRLTSLHEELGREEPRTAAAENIRSLVDEIVLNQEDGELKVDPGGDLSGILAIASMGGNSSPVGTARTGLGVDRNLS